MKLVVEIELGNDAMKYPNQVATALIDVSRQVRRSNVKAGEGRKILDGNGNGVGRWEFKDEA